MPHGELFFRKNAQLAWVDMYDAYGISFSDISLSRLMTPVPNKEVIENKSRLQNGKRIVRNSEYAKKDERDVSIEMYIQAPDKATFWLRYNQFCTDFLDQGFFDIASVYVKDATDGAQVTVGGTNYGKLTVFRMTYESCEAFSEFCQELAKFTLKLNEPDPTNRLATNAWSGEGFDSYTIISTENTMVAPATGTATLNTKLYFIKKDFQRELSMYECYWTAYFIGVNASTGADVVLRKAYSSFEGTDATVQLAGVNSNVKRIVFFITDTELSGSAYANATPTTYLARLEIPVIVATT